MKLEEKLVSLRKAKGLSQLKLAEMMNVSRQAISRWEVGAATPSIENLKYLGRLYDVPLEYLLHDDAPVTTQQEENNNIKVSEGKKRRNIILIAIIITVVVLLGAILLEESQQKVVPIENIEGSEVETRSENEFELDF